MKSEPTDPDRGSEPAFRHHKPNLPNVTMISRRLCQGHFWAISRYKQSFYYKYPSKIFINIYKKKYFPSENELTIISTFRSYSAYFGVIPGQNTEVFRTRLKNIFFYEKPQIYTILRNLNLFFNTFCVLGAFF